MRWKAFFFLNPSAQAEVRETYGFNSTKTPPNVPEMKNFEDKMTNLIQSIKFEKRSNHFQNKLGKKVKEIKREKKILVKADKTSNYYKMLPGEYSEMLEKNVKTAYKKAPTNISTEIDKEAKEIATTLKIVDRVDKGAKREAFITLKDHKPNFMNKPTCRLINPAKSELGRASKIILQKVIKNIQIHKQLNLWRSTLEVIEWFKQIDKRKNTSFISFDVVEFYPSITNDLLDKALKFASQISAITPQEVDLIHHTKKSLLYTPESTWIKTTHTNFDVTMGSYDGAETCELIGLFLLSELCAKHGCSIGLYRDDGLAVINKTPREVENTKKSMCQMFKEHGLKITIEANKKVVNFLDVTLDLNKNTFQPFKKPNDTPLYVNSKSNHPPSVIRNIPKGINKRLSTLSSNKEIFEAATHEHQEALKASGHKHILTFNVENKLENSSKEEQNSENSTLVTRENAESTPENNKKSMKSLPPKTGKMNDKAKEKNSKTISSGSTGANKNRKRQRNIIWFNPPFEGTVTTNVGKEFFKIVDECFPENHKLHKIFNRSTIKLSYSCMPNIKQIIDGTNKEKLNSNAKSAPQNENACNCRKSEECPLQNQCLASGIVYQATVTETATKQKETYIGMTETTFKQRYANHKQSFKQEQYRHQTELSKHIWTLKDTNTAFDVTWKLIQFARSYSTSSKKCNLCTAEKFYILCKRSMATLNSRTEIITTCRHRKKSLLINVI